MNEKDNCPIIANAGQENSDGDSYGNACDICPFDPQNDSDNDGLCACISQGCPVQDKCTGGNHAGCADNCPSACNSQQLDADGDGIGDVCDDINNRGCGGCGQPTCEQSCQ